MTIKKNLLFYILIFAVSSLLSAVLIYATQIIPALYKTILYLMLAFFSFCGILLYIFEKTSLFRLTLTLMLSALVFAALACILDVSGFWQSVSTVDTMKEFIRSQGIYSSIVFFLIQVLQVVAIPIPGVVTVSVGTYVFGPVWGSLLSYAGIICGSVLAFIIGRRFGYKLVKWIIGEEQLKKTLKLIKGKDKVMFTMIFLLPFFPDDMLCFVAGLTSMSLGFFTVMAMGTRIITIVVTVFFTKFIELLWFSESILGYAVLVLSLLILTVIFILSVKHGEKIQNFFERFISKRLKKKTKNQ